METYFNNITNINSQINVNFKYFTNESNQKFVAITFLEL